MQTPALDHYHVIRRCQATAFGPGFEAEHPHRPGRYLVELLSAVAPSPAAFANFAREVNAIAGLRHPHILQVFEISVLPDGTPVVVSELPEGETLEAWLLRGNALAPETLGYVIAALADALTAAHAIGVCHGGIRAENVRLVPLSGGPIGRPKLQGFGQASLRGKLAFKADDLAGLAALAEQLVIPAALRTNPGERAFLLEPALRRVLARAAGTSEEEPFASPTEFALALAQAVKPLARPQPEANTQSEADTPAPEKTASGPRVWAAIGVAAVSAAAGTVFALTTRPHFEFLRAGGAAPAPPPAAALAEPPLPPAALPLTAGATPAAAMSAAMTMSLPALAAPAPAPAPGVPAVSPAEADRALAPAKPIPIPIRRPAKPAAGRAVLEPTNPDLWSQ